MAFTLPVFHRPIPLTFDRVADDQPVTSQTLLFRFPIELLPNVVQDLSPSDLRALALVDHDCNQLARSLQFTRVSFKLSGDASDVALELLEALEREERVPNLGRRRRMSPCIRSLRVHLRRVDTPLFNNVMHELVLPRISHLCSVLPNLHILDWDAPSPYTIPTNLAKHIRLQLGPSIYTSVGATTLESLIVEVGGPSESLRDLLLSSGSGLHALVCRGVGEHLASLSLSPILGLPNLRQLHLEGLATDNVEAKGLRRLVDLSVARCHASMYQVLSRAGPLPSLRRLQVDPTFSHEADSTHLLEFLTINTHISSLDIIQPMPNPETALLPVLVHRFSNLRTLRLVFERPPSPDAISTLGQIPSLEALWLSAGTQHGCSTFNSQWEVDHSQLLPSSNTFTNLKTLVFTRDTYTSIPPNSPVHPLLDPSMRSFQSRFYYRDRRLPPNTYPEDWLSPEECEHVLGAGQGLLASTTPSRAGGGGVNLAVVPAMFDFDAARRGWREVESVAWERWHADRMGKVAKQWFEAVPMLEMVYVGRVKCTRDWRERDFDGALVEACWRGVVEQCA